VTELLLPVLLVTAPVLLVVALAILFGRRLTGSCGGVGPDGSCSRCGKPAAEMPAARGERERCP
jgi:hypothetical protein